MNKPTLVAIFAHPDDEAFGPGGTLSLYTKTHDVYIICATRGEVGRNHSEDQKRKIAEIREEELYRSAKILGIKKVYFLDYADGTLSNDKYHEIADTIRKYTDTIQPEIFMTFEPRGVSGHIDHMALSMITHFIFYKVSYAKELLLFCMTTKERETIQDYFIYMPPGYPDSEIGLTIDTTSVWDKQVEAMMEHKSQRKDALEILEEMKDLPKEEHFLVVKK